MLEWKKTRAYATFALYADGEKTGYTVRQISVLGRLPWVVAFETDLIDGTEKTERSAAKTEAEQLYRDRVKSKG
jgi:hypothetical protein